MQILCENSEAGKLFILLYRYRNFNIGKEKNHNSINFLLLVKFATSLEKRNKLSNKIIRGPIHLFHRSPTLNNYIANILSLLPSVVPIKVDQFSPSIF